MIPSVVKYNKADNVTDALNILSASDDCKVLSGGHSLIPAMKLRLSSPESLVDIRGLPELRFIRQERNEIVMGACTTHQDVENSELIAQHVPMFVEGASMIGDIQIRNFGTIGGNIAHADPASDWPALLLASGGKVEVRNTKGERQIEIDDFFQGLFTTALESDEIIVSVRIPIPPKGSKSTYQKFLHPASRYAVVGCAANIQVDGGNCVSAKVAYAGLSTTHYRDSHVEKALAGKPFNQENIEAVCEMLATSDVDIASDGFASAEYRLHLGKVFTRKALQACL